MKRKKETKFRWSLCVIACLFILSFDGCGDSQSPNAAYVGDYEVSLMNQGAPAPQYLDAWAVSPDEEGRDICGLAHGFFLQL